MLTMPQSPQCYVNLDVCKSDIGAGSGEGRCHAGRLTKTQNKPIENETQSTTCFHTLYSVAVRDIKLMMTGVSDRKFHTMTGILSRNYSHTVIGTLIFNLQFLV